MIHVSVMMARGRAKSLDAMDKLQADITEMKTQSSLLATSIKSMSDTIAAVGMWMPQVDSSIDSLKSTIEAVGARVAVLEAEQQMDDVPITLRLEGHDIEEQHLGVTMGAITAPARTLVKGKRDFAPTPVQFNLVDTPCHTPSSGSRIGNSFGRIPRTDFPKFDGDNP